VPERSASLIGHLRGARTSDKGGAVDPSEAGGAATKAPDETICTIVSCHSPRFSILRCTGSLRWKESSRTQARGREIVNSSYLVISA